MDPSGWRRRSAARPRALGIAGGPAIRLPPGSPWIPGSMCGIAASASMSPFLLSPLATCGLTPGAPPSRSTRGASSVSAPARSERLPRLRPEFRRRVRLYRRSFLWAMCCACGNPTSATLDSSLPNHCLGDGWRLNKLKFGTPVPFGFRRGLDDSASRRLDGIRGANRFRRRPGT